MGSNSKAENSFQDILQSVSPITDTSTPSANDGNKITKPRGFFQRTKHKLFGRSRKKSAEQNDTQFAHPLPRFFHPALLSCPQGTAKAALRSIQERQSSRQPSTESTVADTSTKGNQEDSEEIISNQSTPAIQNRRLVDYDSEESVSDHSTPAIQKGKQEDFEEIISNQSTPAIQTGKPEEDEPDSSSLKPPETLWKKTTTTDLSKASQRSARITNLKRERDKIVKYLPTLHVDSQIYLSLFRQYKDLERHLGLLEGSAHIPTSSVVRVSPTLQPKKVVKDVPPVGSEQSS